MAFGTTAAILAGTALSAGSSVAGGAMASRGAKKAARQQAEGAAKARGEYQGYGANARKVLEDEYWKARNEDFKDYTSVGGEAVTRLGDLALNTNELTPEFEKYDKEYGEFKFGKDDFEKDPGYEFRLAEGQKALERSAAARGGLRSGGTLKELERYAQGQASGEYGKAFQRAYDTYGTNRSTFTTNRETWEANQLGKRTAAKDKYAVLTDLANLGYSATRDRSRVAGGFAGDIAGQLEREGSDVAGTYLDAANARAAGTVGSSNAWSNAVTSVGDLAQRYAASKWGTPSRGRTSMPLPPVPNIARVDQSIRQLPGAGSWTR